MLHIDAISGSCNLDDPNFSPGFFLVSHLSTATVTQWSCSSSQTFLWLLRSVLISPTVLHHPLPTGSLCSLHGRLQMRSKRVGGEGERRGMENRWVGKTPRGVHSPWNTELLPFPPHLGKVQGWQELSMREAKTCPGCETDKKEKYPSPHQVQLHQGIWTLQRLPHPMNPGSPGPKLLTWANRYSRELASRRGVASGTFFFS